ncbi:dipeptide/oligopeptide/nickel ABC transporter permease/ATP-binding protein [Leifsonia sp. NPDC058230]|uniref:dipeptide/oligopeptide/nickel ABC transporter permease/ATP-binding protein n=1 Tax=Leifsonia sp. NPDC058230 TaxID=3346391 RepID=UPI0036D9360F
MSVIPADGASVTSGAVGFRGLVRRLKRRPLGIVALAFLLLVVIAVIFAPLIAPYGPLQQDLKDVLSLPSPEHLLGGDTLGRDILSRLLYGGRVSLMAVVYAVGTLLVISVPTGLAAGYLGGAFDRVVMTITDILLAIPHIIMLLVVLAIFSNDEVVAMIALGILGSPGVIRIVRSAAIAVRPELYVTAARVGGLSTPRILTRHILPRVSGPIIVQASLFAGVALLTETGLGFLGLGVQDPQPSWGNMVGLAATTLSQDPWMLVPPGVLIGLCVLAFGLLGDAVRDVSGVRGSRLRRKSRNSRTTPARAAAAATPGTATTALHSDVAPDLLEVENLTVAFPDGSGEITVVDGVSFTLRAGESLGLVGESGCGKSVTAWAILGLLTGGGRIIGGSCRLDGKELIGSDAGEYRRIRGSQIAVISQEAIASLDPNYTVGNQIAQVVRLNRKLGRAAIKARVLELLSLVDLPDPAGVAGKYPWELSGGMAQRVSIAAALAGEPRLLIADEPTTALDVTVQAEILDLLRRLQSEEHLAILMVTHDWGVVADLCQQAAVMYAGQIVEYARVDEMIARPLNPYTDGLLRSDPHRVEVGDELPSIAGTVPAPADWPRGCRFAPRCPLATAACREEAIPMVDSGDGRLSRCIRVEELVQRSREYEEAKA